MSTDNDVHFGDVGTVFRLTLLDDTVPFDVSGATLLQIKFRKPTNATVSKTAALTGDGTDGVIEYTGEDGLIDELGTWRMQGYVELPGGKWHSTTGFFKVSATI